MSAVVESENPYSKLVYWEVWNFMSIAHAKAEFDERNIINLKGYNDSGKSAMLTALKVLMCNSNPSKQVSFIQDDKDYFRIIGCFDDGVMVLRDKYINGQSLYEMYKDNKVIFSTKNGNALTKVTGVPQPIADYFGLIMYDDVCLNARSCFEKQIGVQTTGSENYKMFNTVLKSEEIATAGTLLNNDKNKLASDIDVTDYELQAQKNLLGVGQNLTESLILSLKEHDSLLDIAESGFADLNNISNILSMHSSIQIYPEFEVLNTQQSVDLEGIQTIISELSGIKTYPEVPIILEGQSEDLGVISDVVNALNNLVITPGLDIIDDNQIDLLTNIADMKQSLSGVVETPSLDYVDEEQLQTLETILSMLNTYNGYSEVLKNDEERLTALSKELDELHAELTSKGIRMVRCPDCGSIFNPDEVHIH